MSTIALDRWLGLAEQNNTITITDDSEPEARKIGGQMVVIHGNHCYVWIKKGAWLTAGREFNWKRKEPGFSINRTIVEYADTNNLTIRIINATNFSKCYEISASNFVEFVKETDSITQKSGAILFVIPWSKCKTVNDDVKGIVQSLREVI